MIIGFLIGAAIVAALGIWSTQAAYRNGVTDGYGFSREPDCPGYRKAGEFLRKRMAHRWAELAADSQPDHFFEYLSPANKPVVSGLEQFEVVYAKDQPEYIPLRTIRSRTDEGKVMSRWDLTTEQRHAIAKGADIYLTLLTFQGPLQPITLAVATDINPDYVRLDFNLQPQETLQSQLRKM